LLLKSQKDLEERVKVQKLLDYVQNKAAKRIQAASRAKLVAQDYQPAIMEVRSENAYEEARKEASDMLENWFRKNAAKTLGIWFPMQEDKDKWFLDPRTKSLAMEFETCVTDAIAKMRSARSILQYIPRRKFTNATVEDLKNNIERIKQYCKTH
jgi:DNA-directed RNA polymerase subunit K/omega